jgi:hypothetical protein
MGVCHEETAGLNVGGYTAGAICFRHKQNDAPHFVWNLRSWPRIYVEFSEGLSTPDP